MKTSADGRAAIVQREGVRTTAYRDSVGIWTIGIGHTSAVGAPKVQAGMKITRAEADAILARDLVSFERSVNSAVKVGLTQNQFDALVSLAFNIGVGAFRNSTLVRKLNAGDVKGAADQFLVWNKGTIGGRKVVIGGLVARRRAERAQFLSGYGAATARSVSKAIPTPAKAETAPTASPVAATGICASLAAFSRMWSKK